MTDPDAPDVVPASQPPTWRRLLATTAEVTGDRAAARWLCETASGAFGSEFLDALDRPAADGARAHLDAMVSRFGAGEPIQYVLGHWSFRRLDLAIDRRVLIPRPETEMVAGVAIEIARSFGPVRTVADLGTGSGAIGLALADELPIDGTTVWLTDVDEEALDVARANLAGIGRGARNVRLASGSWTAALPAGVQFDVIVTNPPYIAVGSADVEPAVADWEPPGALYAGADGLDAVRVVVADAYDRLRPGGALVLEIGADQGEAVRALLAARGFDDVRVQADLTGRDRIAVGRRPTAM